jgi:peptidoglycan/xylan/chitin deacetylase (PgdA/CDA1 family)
MIPEQVERRARWVLEMLGAGNHQLGDDVPYDAGAWAEVDRGERPAGDELAQAFYDLARVEERHADRDEHGRFRARSTALDPTDPPLERLRARLGATTPRWGGARFAVALTHDVDTPWRWTRIGVRGAGARLKDAVAHGQGAAAIREARALAAVPVHRLRGTDPNWSFDRVLQVEGERNARSTFFVLAGHSHRADGASPETYERLRPRLVETITDGGGEIGLHGSYLAAEDEQALAHEKAVLERLAGPVTGQRYHYLRVQPDANLATLEQLGFGYDSTVGFADAPGFRAGIAHPYRPWDMHRDRPLDLVEIPLALMDTSFEDRYLGLSSREAEEPIMALIEWAAEHGGGFAVLWHTDRFDAWTAAGWDRLYARLIEAVHDHGGACMSAGELAREAQTCL